VVVARQEKAARCGAVSDVTVVDGAGDREVLRNLGFQVVSKNVSDYSPIRFLVGWPLQVEVVEIVAFDPQNPTCFPSILTSPSRLRTTSPGWLWHVGHSRISFHAASEAGWLTNAFTFAVLVHAYRLGDTDQKNFD
jgi:hypothetical protein